MKQNSSFSFFRFFSRCSISLSLSLALSLSLHHHARTPRGRGGKADGRRTPRRQDDHRSRSSGGREYVSIVLLSMGGDDFDLDLFDLLDPPRPSSSSSPFSSPFSILSPSQKYSPEPLRPRSARRSSARRSPRPAGTARTSGWSWRSKAVTTKEAKGKQQRLLLRRRRRRRHLQLLLSCSTSE